MLTASWTRPIWSNAAAIVSTSFAGEAVFINVGGLKIHPEEVEAAINRHPATSACRWCVPEKAPSPVRHVTADVVL
jgi:hypothetical protein